MDSTSSLSKGCFAFTPASTKSKRKKQSAHKDEFSDYQSLPEVSLYSRIIKEIETRLKDINKSASDEVLQELTQFVSQCSEWNFAIPTAVLLTGVNLPDHHELFQGLADRVREEVTQHVSVLLSSECCTVKSTIEQLTSQFLRQHTVSMDSQMDIDDSDSEEEDVFDDVKRSQCTMPNLLSWYYKINNEQSNKKQHNNQLSPGKLVVIIPDFESFSSRVLQDVILILSSYLSKLPLVLVFGVATSVKALQSSLPHRVTSRMDVRMFQSRPSVHFLNNTVNEIFLTWKTSKKLPFLLGPKIFKFLTDVFIFYDFSVHGFIQGIKYCLMEHFCNNPLSKLCCSRKQLKALVNSDEVDVKSVVGEVMSFRKYIENLPPSKVKEVLRGERVFKDTVLNMLQELQDHKENLLVCVWLLHSLVHDLPEAPLGKQVREVYIEVMSGPIMELPSFARCFDLLNLMSKQDLLQKIDEMNRLLEESQHLEEIQCELQELRKEIEDAGQNINSPMSSPTKRDSIGMCSDRKQLREKLLVKSVRMENEFERARSKLLSYLKKVFEKYLVSPSTLPLHEVMLIDNMSAKRHIVGAPRAAVHVALNNPHHYLQCECCKNF